MVNDFYGEWDFQNYTIFHYFSPLQPPSPYTFFRLHLNDTQGD